MIRTTIDWLGYLALRIVMCIVLAIRLETCRMYAGYLATFCCRVLRIRAAVVDENLRHAFPRLSPCQRLRVTHQMWVHLFLMIVEIAHARRKIHDTNWREHIDLRNGRKLIAHVLEDRPLVMVSGHFGNFELAGYLLGVLGVPTFTVARPLKNPFIDQFLNEFRGAKGQVMLSKSGSSGEIDQLLSSNGTLLLLGDQSGGPKGCWTEFFSRPASVHKAIGVFALMNDAPLAVCFSRRSSGNLQFEIGMAAFADPRDNTEHVQSVAALSTWFTKQLETIIRRSPDQYWWLHRRWKDKRESHNAKRRQRRQAA